MAQADPTAFIDPDQESVRGAEVPLANWGTGGDLPASCSPGIGISNAETGLQQSLPSWTLLDQDGDARDPQVGQVIGGGGATSAGEEGKGTYGIIYAENPADGQGGFVSAAETSLTDLAVGWAAIPIP